MQLVLYVDGIKADTEKCDFGFVGIFDESRLLAIAIETLKIRNKWLIRNSEEWEIFSVHKSKLQ